MDFNLDDWLEVPVKWLETLVDYLPEWPPSWLPDSPPDWLIDLVEKYTPYLPSAYFSDIFQFGLPHFYVQQNVCEKAFDIGVLILTFGTLIIIIFLLRRCLASETSQLKERWICYECRAEKSEVLSEDLIHVEKKVELLKNACQNVNKKLQGCIQGQGTDGPALEKRLKKIPEILLSNSMLESSAALGDRSIFGIILKLCSKVQKLLGNEMLEYEADVERNIINKQMELLEIDIPNIVKQRKHLAKLTLDMDSAKTRYQTASRHSLQTSGTNAAKADVIKEEMDDASMKVEQCRDLLVSDMFNLISKESEIAQHFVTLVKCQAEYHKKALNILDNYTNCMEEEIKNSHCLPVYGCLLDDHLKVAERHIALPLEFCICFLIECGVNEEGLFRVAGSASKVKKLKTAFDANMFDILDMSDYVKDPHAVAGALKSYLRELPNPLMTHELYNEWIQAARITDTDTRLQALWSIVQKLPVPYFNNLRYIMKFLNKLAANQEVNKMTAQNLAIVIAPNLIWAPEEGSTALGMNMSLANMYSLIVDNLIVHADWFFPGEVEFYLPSPLLRSPHDSFTAAHPPENENLPLNGELDIHPSLLTVESNSVHYNQQSPQFGGSPKSLRRNKKPAPPAPSVLREKPFAVEKSDKNISSDSKLEKTIPDKVTVERRLSSSSSEKEKHLPVIASSKSVYLDKNNANNVEKPQIPEKPNFEKIMTSSTDLTKSNVVSTIPIPMERHHVEKAQTQMSAVDKNQPSPIHVSDDISPLPEESKNVLPEIALPSVESESDDDEGYYVPYRPRSPAPIDRFDYYRPDWYGSEQDDSEKIQDPEKSRKIQKAPSDILYFKKRVVTEKSSRIIEEPKITVADALNMANVPEPVKTVEPNVASTVELVNAVEPKFLTSDDHILTVKNKPNKAETQMQIEIEALHKIENKIAENESCFRPSLESPSKALPSSDELIVIGIPPHSIQFVRPEHSMAKEGKDPAARTTSISPDILGNLPFLSRKSPTLTDNMSDKISKNIGNHDLMQNSSTNSRVEIHAAPSSSSQTTEQSQKEVLLDEIAAQNVFHAASLSDQKQDHSLERIDLNKENFPNYSRTPQDFPKLSSRSESEIDYEFGDNSCSYTDSDRWSHSERSLSPEFLSSELYSPQRQYSLPLFGDYSDSVEEPMFQMSNYWHPATTDQPVHQRPISPESSQSVPYVPFSKLTRVDCRSSSTSLPRRTKPVDAWFSSSTEPVAKPRRPHRTSPASSSRPKRPDHPPKLRDTKPKRPERPPQFVTVENLSARGIAPYHIHRPQEQEPYTIPFELLPLMSEDTQKMHSERATEGSLQTRIRGSPAAPKRPPRPQPPPPPPPFKPRHNSSSEDTHL